jgi:hypothetical protein
MKLRASIYQQLPGTLQGAKMTDEKNVKVTFYAEPDIKEWLDKLDSGIKSRSINALLRDALKQKLNKTKSEERFDLIESRLRKLEKDMQFDGFSIAALRRVLLNRFGPNSTEEFKKEYDDLYFGAPRPPRGAP